MWHVNLLTSLWGDVLLTVAYVLNRVPSKFVSSTPYELWMGRTPGLSQLRPWGSTTDIHDISLNMKSWATWKEVHLYKILRAIERVCTWRKYAQKCYRNRIKRCHVHGKDFPTRGEIDKDLLLYEMEDPIDSVTNTKDNQISDITHPSGSNTSHVYLQEPHSSSVHQSIPHRCFPIENEALTINPFRGSP